MLRCYYSSAEYLPVTYSSSPTLLQSEWANRQVRSSHVKIPGPSSQGEREGAAHEQYGVCITTRPLAKEFYGPQSIQVLANESVHCMLRNKNCVHNVKKTTPQYGVLENREHLTILCNVLLSS